MTTKTTKTPTTGPNAVPGGNTARGRPFPPGVSGNPSGRPKAVRELLELARAEVPASFDLAKKLRDDETQDGRVRLEAAKFLTAYGLGAPPKAAHDDRDGDGEEDPLSKLSDAEIADLASRRLSTEH